METITPRSFWPLGSITEIYARKNQIIRSVKLKLPNSILIWLVNKISLLEGSTWHRSKPIQTGAGVCFMNGTRQMTLCCLVGSLYFVVVVLSCIILWVINFWCLCYDFWVLRLSKTKRILLKDQMLELWSQNA